MVNTFLVTTLSILPYLIIVIIFIFFLGCYQHIYCWSSNMHPYLLLKSKLITITSSSTTTFSTTTPTPTTPTTTTTTTATTTTIAIQAIASPGYFAKFPGLVNHFSDTLQSSQVKRTHQDSINEFIVRRLNLLDCTATSIKIN